MGDVEMDGDSRVYHVKLDSSGRLLIPAEARERHQISVGDTMVVIEDKFGLRVKTRDELLADAQAYFAALVPSDVLLSDEVNQDRRSEHERD
jgi:bifunctional DNA-binding transcriptional regulator/antitoxin component of YhaV-PrlF toxin-antitoxin module